MKDNKSKDNVKGALFLVLSAFLYSIMPVLIRFLGQGALPPMAQVFFRYIVAFISALIYFFFLTKAKIAIHKKDILFILLATVFGYALTNLFFTYGILYTQVGNALFLFYSYAIITPILGYLFLKDKINRFNIMSLFLSLLALLLLVQPNSISTWKIGGFFAILAALGQAVYLILRKKLYSYSSAFLMLSNTFIGVITLGILSIIFEKNLYFKGGINHLSLKTWITTLIFGVDNFLAWLTMTKGFEYFKATAGSLILLSELLFGILFAFIFFKEVPTTLTVIGGMLLLFSISTVILKGEN